MKCVSICTTGRVDYVKACLESLQKNATEGWTLLASMEPGHPEVHRLINSVTFMPVKSWVNGRRLGPELNTFMAHWMAFEEGADAVLYFDDDMVLSPDALALCNWYLDYTEYHDPARFAGICLCARHPNLPDRPASISPNDTWQGMVGQGYCYTRAQWQNFVKRNFWVHHPFFGGDGYDWALGHMAVHLNKIILRPRFSRSRHTGRNGFHGDNVDTFPDAINQATGLDYVVEET
jgi:hypothetical protein